MGRLARLLSFVRTTRNGIPATDVKFNPGGGANVTGPHLAPPGDDSHPLPDDFIYAGGTSATGSEAVLGYVDPVNEPIAGAGEKRIYARDAATGVVVAEVWLKNDGSILSSNDNGSSELQADGSILGENSNGSFELQANGDFVVNGVTINTNGNITTAGTVNAGTVEATTSLTVAGKEMSGHTHSQGNDSASDTQQNTSGPI